MPSLKCRCDNRIDFGQIPNPNEWLLVSDVAYDKYDGIVNSEDLYSEFEHALRCPNCQRLWVFWNGFSEEPTCYEAQPKKDQCTSNNKTRRVYIGYSTTLNGREMIQYFDIDPLHDDRLSKFEQNFGSPYIQPGSFEVYGKETYGNDFNAAYVKDLFPFDLEEIILSKISFDEARCVFFVETESVDIKSAKDATLLGPIDVEKYNFE
ncbi:hypothetical protein [uncultured Paraglaciecola sp.]|uniref:hypothetical protein n=1 Tax=uncultured Paraglaciecola sp. TaxID=1765024 RepID=UPI0026343B75|nr:hypothetical protein [uncultured Paraglaciecola sp.]